MEISWSVGWYKIYGVSKSSIQLEGITSEAIPTSLDTIGIFIAGASKTACGPPSYQDATTYRSHAAYILATISMSGSSIYV